MPGVGSGLEPLRVFATVRMGGNGCSARYTISESQGAGDGEGENIQESRAVRRSVANKSLER